MHCKSLLIKGKDNKVVNNWSHAFSFCLKKNFSLIGQCTFCRLGIIRNYNQIGHCITLFFSCLGTKYTQPCTVDKSKSLGFRISFGIMMEGEKVCEVDDVITAVVILMAIYTSSSALSMLQRRITPLYLLRSNNEPKCCSKNSTHNHKNA